MRKIVFIPLFVLSLIFKGITYLTARVSIPLSAVPHILELGIAWFIELLMKLFPPPRLPYVNMTIAGYNKMIEELEKDRYDRLYDEMKKREDTDTYK